MRKSTLICVSSHDYLRFCSALLKGDSCFIGDEGEVQFSSRGFGQLEICHNGMWGTICGESATQPWSLKNAQVVCGQINSNSGGALNSVLQNTYVSMKILIRRRRTS